MIIEMGNRENKLQDVFISVVVPAFNVEGTIDACLNSLLSQSIPKDKYEIIVVDNGSTDGTIERIKEYPVDYLYEPNCTVYAARNAAVQASNGEIIAFTDSDCVVDEKWLEAGLEYLEEFDLVSGKVEPQPSPRKWLYAYDRYIMRNVFSKEGSEVNIATLNAFVKKTVFIEVGGFESELRTAGDSIFSMRARLRGYSSGFAPSVIVYHPVDGWTHRIRRMMRESQGSKIKAPYKHKEGVSFFRIAWTRIVNVFALMRHDVFSLRVACSQNEIDIFKALGILGISIIMRGLTFFFILTAKIYRDRLQRFTLP